jgi:hypothetical protein
MLESRHHGKPIHFSVEFLTTRQSVSCDCLQKKLLGFTYPGRRKFLPDTEESGIVPPSQFYFGEV